MARIARVVIPGIPHHITQRGNRRQRVFFRDDDYRLYRRLMSEFCSMHDVRVLAYCLMPNHSHLVLTPAAADGLHKAVGEAHRRYTRHINSTHGWHGYLWQGRFASFPMDEAHLYRAVRYVELNPVDAKLCSRPEQWPWSSAKAHLCGENDELVDVMPMLAHIPDWRELSIPLFQLFHVNDPGESQYRQGEWARRLFVPTVHPDRVVSRDHGSYM